MEIKKNSVFIGILKKLKLFFVSFCFFSSVSFSQVLVQYNATNYNPAPFNSLNASGCSSGLATFSTLGISPGSIAPYGYCVAPFTACGYFQITAATQAGFAYCHNTAPSLLTTPDFLSFTVTPVSSNCVYITQFNITMGVYSTGADKVVVGYSNDGGVTWISGPTWTLPHTTTGGGSTGTGNCGVIAAPGGGCATMALYTWNITPFSSATPVIFKIIPYDATTCNCTNGHNGTHEWAFTQVEVDGTVAPLPNITITNPSACSGSSVSLTAAGASTYTWNTGSTANPLSVTASNTTYTVTGTSAAGCTNTAVTTLTVNPTPTVTATGTPVMCNGGATGTASSSIIGGTGPFTYSWSPSGGNAGNASGLSAGNYSVTVTDANGCNGNASVTIVQPTTLTVSATGTNVLCNGVANGSASVTVTGGTAAYTYSWSPSGGTNANASGLNAGTYSVLVTDANNCQNTQSITITQPTALNVTATTTSATCGGNTGTASAIVSGGTGPYTYSWTPTGGNTANANALAGGTYTVNVTDANGCTNNATAVVTQPVSFSLNATSTSVTCNGGATGTASITVTGGAGPFTYSWSPSGGNAANAIGLSAGNYSVTVNDPSGCSVSSSVNIAQPTILTANVTGTNVLCNGVVNGSASVTVTGGTPVYTYSWSPSGGTTSSATGLASGTYTVKIIDANNCQTTQSITITQPTALAVTVTTTSTTCSGNNGTASATVTGGTSPYTYTWLPSGGNTANANSLGGGAYTVNITDANGCTTNASGIVIQPVPFSVSVTTTSVSCNGGTNGAASVVITGGAGPFTYSWSPSGGTNANASGLNAGNYAVIVTDPNNCASSTPVTVIQPAQLTTNVTGINVLCNVGNTGSATATATGGTGAYTYTWSPFGGNTATASSLTAGTYTVNVTDGNGCTATSSQTITEPTALSASTATTSVTCNGGNNGSAAVTVTGGTSPYIYSWIPSGATTSIVNNLSAGSYTVNITDANGCINATTAVISQPTSLNITITNNPANCGLSNGTATAVVTGGITPYTYQWYPSGGITNTPSNLSAGSYTLVVTDANNCFNSGVTTIANTGIVNITVSNTNVSCNGGTNGTATVSASGGTAPYTYLWSSGSTTTNATNLNIGNYTVTVEDNAGCVQTATVTITQPTPVTVVATGTTICNGQTATLTATASGGTAPYIYSWNAALPQAANTATFSPASTTVYSVTAFDANGCPANGSVATVNVLPPLQVTTGDATICAGNNATLIANASGGNGNYIYTWMPGNLSGSSISVSPLSTTVYTVTVSDGCTTTNANDTGVVKDIIVPVLNLPAAISGCAPQCMNFSVATNTNVVSWQWSFGNNATSSFQNPTYCYVTPGSYSVSLTYTTSQGCVNTVIKNNMVTVYPQPQAAFSASTFETDIYNMNISFYNQSIGASNWQWNFGDAGISSVQNPIHTYTDIGNYVITLVVSNQYGCKDSIAHEIIIHDDYTFYAPNAFTPNFDGVNDVFLPEGTGWNLSTYNLWVFDRWGNQLYHSEDADKGWNGTYKSNDIVQQDVYVWKVMLNDIFGKSHEYTGTVSIIK